MRILVTGSRTYSAYTPVVQAIKNAWLDAGRPKTAVVHGCDGGVSLIAHPVALENFDLGFTAEGYPAKFSQFGDRAESLRNHQMIDLGVDLCLAFLGDTQPGDPARMNADELLGLCHQTRIPVIIF